MQTYMFVFIEIDPLDRCDPPFINELWCRNVIGIEFERWCEFFTNVPFLQGASDMNGPDMPI